MERKYPRRGPPPPASASARVVSELIVIKRKATPTPTPAPPTPAPPTPAPAVVDPEEKLINSLVALFSSAAFNTISGRKDDNEDETGQKEPRPASPTPLVATPAVMPPAALPTLAMRQPAPVMRAPASMNPFIRIPVMPTPVMRAPVAPVAESRIRVGTKRTHDVSFKSKTGARTQVVSFVKVNNPPTFMCKVENRSKPEESQAGPSKRAYIPLVSDKVPTPTPSYRKSVYDWDHLKHQDVDETPMVQSDEDDDHLYCGARDASCQTDDIFEDIEDVTDDDTPPTDADNQGESTDDAEETATATANMTCEDTLELLFQNMQMKKKK